MRFIHKVIISIVFSLLKRITSKETWESIYSLTLKKLDSNQEFWERQYNYALYKMNYGNGSDLTQSGELYVLKFIRNYYKSQKIVLFDVGANIGSYCSALQEIFSENREIYCFEPSIKTFEILKETTKTYKAVTNVNIGFSNETTVSELYSNYDGSVWASVYQRNLDLYDIKLDSIEKIQLDTIDNFCKTQAIEKIHFLKLDIEGHELNALKGAQECISNNVIDFIQFEFGYSNTDSKIFFRDFFNLLHEKYAIYRILIDGFYEMKEYKETHEIFITTNYFAIRKDLKITI